MTNSVRPACVYDKHLNRPAHEFIKSMKQVDSKTNWFTLLEEMNVKTNRIKKIRKTVLILLMQNSLLTRYL